MAAKSCCPPRSVYRLNTDDTGVNVRRWRAAPDAVPHANVDEIWTGPIDPLTGFPTHPNTPTADVVEPDWNYAGPDDQMEAWGWIDVPAGGGFLRDNNSNTGERGEAWIGLCCGTPNRQPGYFEDANTGADRNIMDVVPIPEGIHFLYVRSSDFSANQGFDLEFSVNGTTGWSNFPAAQSYATKPMVECQEIGSCDPIPAGWSLCPPTICSPVLTPSTGGGGGGGLDADDVQDLIDASVPPPANATPIPDNETDTAIRTGQVGTSTDYAREDHNHPIRRQANPGDPAFGFSGVGSLNATVILDRWSTEEWYAYRVRLQVINQTAGNGWSFVTVPTKAGFQQPQISAVGTYRYNSTAIQEDEPGGNGGDGAGPRGPFMGQEAHHWSSTNRIYLGYFRRENTFNAYLEFTVRYIRT
jgi:hypothetical protein